ncbi:MAG: hypothetical protein GVY11_07155 [Gammaproteobacteria bacterium]|jgi:hypothetical protein|nr:hypothetical protein [Gammaproteobacteria bacterium]
MTRGILDMPNALPATLRLCVLLLAAVATAATAQQTFSTLEERMTGEEFRDTGLYKLSDEELAALNRWIRQRSLTQDEAIELMENRGSGASADTAQSDRRGFPASSGSDEPIRARIDGTFSGWEGNTEFVLQNGMVWRQTQSGSFSIGERENPEVTIRPGMFGSWYLSIDGYNREVRVERIQ